MPDSYRRLLIAAAGGIAAFSLHVGMGWPWTVAAAVGVGIAVDTNGWWYGGLALLADWTALVIWNFALAAGAVLRMSRTMGELLGDLPGWAFLGVTLFIGFSLGALGGLVGGQLRGLARHLTSRTSDVKDRAREVRRT